MTTTQATECTRCGRTLRSAASIARGMGATCAARARAERAAKAAQVQKARELVEDGGVARTTHRTTRRHVVFEVVASNGTARYLTTVTACTCPAGRKGRACYHRLATRLAA